MTEHFAQAHWRRGQWRLRGELDSLIDPAGMIGRTVNIGTKDGEVYDAVTVRAFNADTGYLTLAGGRRAWAYRDREPEDVVSLSLSLHDIARGYIHEEAA